MRDGIEQLSGNYPLTAATLDWVCALLHERDQCAELVAHFGSPVNVLCTDPFRAHIDELVATAATRAVALRVRFARKANKAVAFVDAARTVGQGVDVASTAELAQCLARGVDGDSIIVTAAVKPPELLELARASGACVALDNCDELAAWNELDDQRAPHTAVRLATRVGTTRFGMSAAGWLECNDALPPVSGVHFHLHGYAADDRVSALDEAIQLVDELRRRGHPVRFVDMGGGMPMSYLAERTEWDAWWHAHEAGAPGMLVDDHRLTRTSMYPYWQAPVRAAWLSQILDAHLPTSGERVHDALHSRSLELQCEPGRALLDGCGLTLARVAARKRRSDGLALAVLEMNRTQMRSTSSDVLLDPWLVPSGDRSYAEFAGEPLALVGAYCIEDELLTRRRLRTARGVAVGDLVAFPNTAGYLMHIVESASHQIPLAANVVWTGSRDHVERDAIDFAHPGIDELG